MKRPRIKHKQLSDACLYFAYNEFMNDRKESVSASDIYSRIPDVPLNLIKLKLSEAENDSLLEQTTTRTSKIKPLPTSAMGSIGSMFQEREYVEVEVPSGKYKVTKRGIEAVEKWNDETFEEVSSSLSAGILIENSPFSTQDSVEHQDPTIPERASDIPASDRSVTLNHNSAEYIDATTELDNVINAVEADRTNEFEEKERILTELNAGKTLLKSVKVRIGAITAVLGSTLLFLAKLFAEKAIGEMASTAWAAIKTLIGI